jgi:hypothetical protein
VAIVRRISLSLVAALMMAATAVPSPAAELRISLAELARILTTTLGDAKLRLHNVPGGALDFTPGSSLTIGTTSVTLPIPGRSFEVGVSSYAYYINELNSTKVTISAVPGALRIRIDFESDGPELVGRCVSGLCVGSSGLPEIQWNTPSISVDVAPVSVAGILSLNAKRVEVGGTFAPDCKAATGLFSGSLCNAVLPQARKATAKLKTDLNTTLMSQINGPEIQAKLTGAMRALKLGPAGEIRFSRVALEGDTLALTFCLACQTQ